MVRPPANDKITYPGTGNPKLGKFNPKIGAFVKYGPGNIITITVFDKDSKFRQIIEEI